MQSVLRAVVVAATASVVGASMVSAQVVPYSVRQVAHEGQPSGAGAFLDFGQPVINSNGLVGFEAQLDSGGFVPDRGLFTQNAGSVGLPTLIARNGTPAPGTDTTFNTFFLPHLNNAGQITAHFQLTADGLERNAIYGGQAGALSLLAREGHPAPGPVGTIWRPTQSGSPFPSFDQATNDAGLRLNQAGQVVFTGRTRGADPATVSYALVLGAPTGPTGSVQKIVGGLDPTPLPSVGGKLTVAGGPAYLLNDHGSVLFGGTVFDSPSNDGFGYFIASNGGTDITPVILTGQPSPIPGFDYQTTARTALGFNNAGMVTFLMGLQGPGIEIDINDRAVFAGTPGDVRAVYQANDLVPGAGTGDRFAYDPIGLTMNRHGQIAFATLVRDDNGILTNNQYLMFGTPDAGGDYDLSIIARHGDETGLDGGNYVFSGFQQSALNGNGMYFTAFAHDNSTGQSRRGIWGYTIDEGLFPILAEGQLIEVEPGVFMPIDAFTLVTGSGGEDGKRTGINDDGELAVYLRFPGTGGSIYDHGIYVLTVPPLAIPEPGSLAALVLLAIPAALRRRRSSV